MSSPTPTPLVFVKVDKTLLDAVNPLLIENSAVVGEFANPGKIITRLMSFIFPLAGMALFAILVFAGFEIMMAAIDKKSLETGKQRATAAVIGFILLFLSYWMVKIIELVFGIVILG